MTTTDPTHPADPSAPGAATDPAPLPILFISGWGADHRTFTPQLDAFETQAVYCARLPWSWGESLPEYAARLVHAYNPHGPCVLVGMSMGGMLAQEMAPLLDARAVVLVATARGRQGMHASRALLRALAVLTPTPLAWVLHRGATRAFRFGARRGWCQPLVELEAWRSRDLLRAIRAVLRWRGAPPTHVPIVHIHGKRDAVLKCPDPDTHDPQADGELVLIDDAGHLVSLSHPHTVNDTIARAVRGAQTLA